MCQSLIQDRRHCHYVRRTEGYDIGVGDLLAREVEIGFDCVCQLYRMSVTLELSYLGCCGTLKWCFLPEEERCTKPRRRS